MSTFDDKVFEYIKSASGGGGDGTYPVGMRIRLANGVSVPSTGTWELVGIYGHYTFTENDRNSHSIIHHVDFLGKSIIDSAKTSGTIEAGTIDWQYNSLLGQDNYTITTIFGSNINEDVSHDFSQTSHITNGTYTYETIIGLSDIFIIPETGSNCAYCCQARAEITDVSKVPITDDNLSFEYQRTA